MCNCNDVINDHLAQHGSKLETSWFPESPRVFIKTYVTEKKRGRKAPYMMATYCPFCGEKYPEEKALNEVAA